MGRMTAAMRRAMAAPRIFAPTERTIYRVISANQVRGPWRDTSAEAKRDAVDQGLASWDDDRQEYYLAVPVSLQRRQVAIEARAAEATRAP